MAMAGSTVELVVGPSVVHNRAAGRGVDHDGVVCGGDIGLVVVVALAW